MQAWNRSTYLTLIALIVHGLCLGSVAFAQGQVVKPKPREEEKPRAVQPKERESASESVGSDGVGEVKIGILPFFSATDRFDQQGITLFDDWFKDAVERLLSENAFGGVDHQWITADKVDDKVFEQLPTSRIRGAADLLKPLAKKGIEGIIGSWVESKQESDELVVVFYLPERLELQTYKVSANFERATLEELPDVGYAEEPTQELMMELLRRNLRRVTPIAGPAHSPPHPPPAGNTSNDPGNDPGNDPEGGGGAEGGAGSGGPKVFAVLDYSWELSREEEALDPGYTRALRSYPFRDTTIAALRGLVGAEGAFKAKSSEAVSFDQIEAPVLDLDLNADPKAREKALLARAGPGVDALIFGHVQQVDLVNGRGVQLLLRLLSKNGYQYVRARATWRWRQDLSSLRVGGSIENALRDLLAQANNVGMAAPEDYFEIEVLAKDSVSAIARRCYPVPPFDIELAYKLCNHNGILECNKIDPGDLLVIPMTLGLWNRNDPSCLKGQPHR